jgi:hypothetical protein
MDSFIVTSFPRLLDKFRKRRFALLWRGSRDGFGARNFHERCDGNVNTLVLIWDTGGNVFGGFTPLKWEGGKWIQKQHKEGPVAKCDDSLESFLFTLKNPHGIPPTKFRLKAEKKKEAIYCRSSWGPRFGVTDGIYICNRCNEKASNSASLGDAYANDTGLDGKTVFAGSEIFQVREIEVFEIKD